MIEITRGKSANVYRINEYCATELLARKNKPYARWYVHSRHATPSHAIAKLLELERESEDGDE